VASGLVEGGIRLKMKRLNGRGRLRQRSNKCTSEGKNDDEAKEKVILLVSTRLQTAKCQEWRW
jgi:hypothetical protein